MLNTRRSNGFTVVELLVLLVVLVLLALVVLPALLNPIVVSSKIKCVNNLKNVGLSFRIFATDNEDRFPQEIMLSNGVARANIDAVRVFLTLSNELSTPKILLCPNDAKRRQAKAFTNMSGENVSYFASLTATEQLPQAFLAGDRNLLSNGVSVPPGLFPLSTNVQAGWSQEIHEGRGNICMGDGSVQ
jgi:prepilin-type processing-associated H-X9-DG protein